MKTNEIYFDVRTQVSRFQGKSVETAFILARIQDSSEHFGRESFGFIQDPDSRFQDSRDSFFRVESRPG